MSFKESPGVSLAELRVRSGITQVELAKKIDMSQAALSRIELRTNHKISTLRKYLKALGYELQINVVVSGKRYRLKERPHD